MAFTARETSTLAAPSAELAATHLLISTPNHRHRVLLVLRLDQFLPCRERRVEVLNRHTALEVTAERGIDPHGIGKAVYNANRIRLLSVLHNLHSARDSKRQAIVDSRSGPTGRLFDLRLPPPRTPNAPRHTSTSCNRKPPLRTPNCRRRPHEAALPILLLKIISFFLLLKIISFSFHLKLCWIQVHRRCIGSMKFKTKQPLRRNDMAPDSLTPAPADGQKLPADVKNQIAQIGQRPM
jgi:hypothetical protein